MNFCIAAQFGPEYQPLADLTIDQNRIPYCLKHGYDRSFLTEGFTDFSFDKIRYVLDIMAEAYHDWIYWCACDVLVTNFNIRLEDLIDPTFHLIIANDVNGWNSDSFLIRVSPEGKAYMEHVLNQEARLKGHMWREQQAMVESAQQEPFLNIAKVVPQKVLNSYLYELYGMGRDTKDKLGNPGQWSDGDFVLHFAGTSLSQRLELAKEYLPKVLMKGA